MVKPGANLRTKRRKLFRSWVAARLGPRDWFVAVTILGVLCLAPVGLWLLAPASIGSAALWWTSGAACASLVWFFVVVATLESGGATWLKGELGERWTAEWLGEMESVTVLDGLPAFDRAGDIDHVAVGPQGVFLVETKNTADEWAVDRDGRLKAGRWDKTWVLEGVLAQARALAEFLETETGVPSAAIRPVLLLWSEPPPNYGPYTYERVQIVWGKAHQSPLALTAAPIRLSDDEVKLVVTALEGLRESSDQRVQPLVVPSPPRQRR